MFLVAAILYFSWVWVFLRPRAQLDQQRFLEETRHQNNIMDMILGMADIRLQQSETPRYYAWLSVQEQLFHTHSRFLRLVQYQDSGAGFISQLKDIIILSSR
ncbi:MAG: hypothetical protein R2795_19795 [Saprospiraceae bacterium]